MIYLIDTNVIADLIVDIQVVASHFSLVLQRGDVVGLCDPVQYEVLRGLIRQGSSRKLQIFEDIIKPQLEIVQLESGDWIQTAQFWAQATSKGQQLSDVDLLLAALSKRLDAVIVSSDADFDSLPVKRENWRVS